MKNGILTFVLLLPACAFSCEVDKANAIIADKSGLHGITFREDATFQSRHPATRCLSVIAQNNKKAGLICRSRSSDFLIENGIDTQNSPDSVQSIKFVTISTSISLYRMKKRIVGGKTLYTADIDCDEENGTIYRPTSTCSAAYWPLSDGGFIYTNMTIENHISNQQVLSKEDIDLIISKIGE
jgi:hypothetical protein